MNTGDFFDFFAPSFAGEPSADFNRDTLVGSKGFDFLAAFRAECVLN